MALNYPSNPSEGQLWTDPNGVVWEFKGYGWKEILIPPLSSLTDVDMSNIIVGDRLVYDGEKFISGQQQLFLNNLTDITNDTPNVGDYLVYDGTSWVFSKPDKLVYAEMSTTSGAGIYLIGTTSKLSYFDNVTNDTDNIIDPARTRFTIKESGSYNISLYVCLEDPDRMSNPIVYIRIFNSLGSVKKEYITKHQTNFSDSRHGTLLKSYSNSLNVYENLDVGDFIRLRLRSGADRGGSPLYKINVSMSIIKTNVLL